MGSRRAARELALQYLFSHEFGHEFGHESKGPDSAQTSSSKPPVHFESPKQWLAQYRSDFEVDPEVSEFAEGLCKGVIEHKTKIDPIIQSHSAHWKISRMSLVDINILRVAVFEMHFSSHSLEPKIVMNEAIDIAKIYGTLDSGAFVNGIIDQIAKSLRK
jgi:N utilization substance protein B